jgi:hypothetical protein
MFNGMFLYLNFLHFIVKFKELFGVLHLWGFVLDEIDEHWISWRFLNLNIAKN